MKAAAIVLLLVLLTGCNTNAPATSPTATPPGVSDTVGPRQTVVPPPPGASSSSGSQRSLAGDQYVGLAAALHRRGVAIWWETDLVARWLEGPASFSQAITRLGELGKVPGVVGFKISDEIGYGDGLTTMAEAAEFLRQARTQLAKVAPGKQLLVDAVVPELGCLPWRGTNQLGCAQRVRLKYPAATAAAIEIYLRAGLIDRLDLSTGLLEDATYAKWGLTKLQAQTEIWGRVRDEGWPRLTKLQARKALAQPNGYQGSPGQAALDTNTYIAVPVAAGAAAVDIWTWRQHYDGNIVSLLASDLAPNPLWTSLVQLRDRGTHLVTHMTPSAMPTDDRGFAHECDLVSSAFSAIFVAAGTG